MKNPINTKLHKNETGMVSILVSIIFIMIISLVTTSFALLMRREQRQALDRQLSTQAYYAAESGVNDAVKAIDKNDFKENVTDCNDEDSPLINVNKDLGNGLSYSCVLIDQKPTSLQYSSVNTDSSTVVKLNATENIESITISWQDEEDSTDFTDFDNHQLPQKDQDMNNLDSTGILRATIIPIKFPISKADLIQNTATYFLYPKEGDPASVADQPYTPGPDQGGFIDGNCNKDKTPRFCSVRISNIKLSSDNSSTKTIYLRLKSIYKASKVTISASNATSDMLELTKAQAVIDSTGKANDVLRRIQVRVPITNDYYYPEFALESGDNVCKKLFVRAGVVTDNCTY